MGVQTTKTIDDQDRVQTTHVATDLAGAAIAIGARVLGPLGAGIVRQIMIHAKDEGGHKAVALVEHDHPAAGEAHIDTDTLTVQP